MMPLGTPAGRMHHRGPDCPILGRIPGHNLTSRFMNRPR